MKRKHNVAKAQARASVMAGKVHAAKLEDRVADIAQTARDKVREAELEARAAELAALTRHKIAEAGIDDKAAELLARARNTAVVQQAADTSSHVADSAREATERTLDRVGEWIGEGKVGDALGLKRKRRIRPWTLVAAAAAAGVAAGLVVFRKRDTQLAEEWGFDSLDTDDGLTRSAAPGVALPLEGRVREAIGSDPRVNGLGPLNINVVDGTVFVRGTISGDVDQDALRSVIEGVDGVTDVDLQVTAGA